MDYEGLKKYGSLVRTGPNYVVTDDPNAIRQINGARSAANRDDWYAGAKLDSVQDNLVSSRLIGPHDALKAKAAHAYGGRDVDFEVVVDAQLGRLVSIIRSTYLASNGQVKALDFAQFIRYFTLDVIITLGFGETLGFMDADDLYGYTASVEKIRE
jgi:hypothetical protein